MSDGESWLRQFKPQKDARRAERQRAFTPSTPAVDPGDLWLHGIAEDGDEEEPEGDDATPPPGGPKPALGIRGVPASTDVDEATFRMMTDAAQQYPSGPGGWR